MKGVNFMRIVPIVLYLVVFLLTVLVLFSFMTNKNRKNTLKKIFWLSIAIIILGTLGVVIDNIFLDSKAWIMIVVIFIHICFAIKSGLDLRQIKLKEKWFHEIYEDEKEP